MAKQDEPIRKPQAMSDCAASKDLTIALVNQTMENFRFSVNKLSQGIIMYLAIQGFSFGVVARGELQNTDLQLASIVNILLSIGCIVFIGTAYKSISVSVSALRDLIGRELQGKVMLDSRLILATYVMLNVFVIVAIIIWVTKMVH